MRKKRARVKSVPISNIKYENAIERLVKIKKCYMFLKQIFTAIARSNQKKDMVSETNRKKATCLSTLRLAEAHWNDRLKNLHQIDKGIN